MNASNENSKALSSSEYGAWNRFWFRPADPTTLCLIRILAGAAIFMIHFSYCFDLQELLGPHAWINSELAAETRKHIPVTVPPSSWDYPTPEPTANEEQRQQVNGFIRKWGFHPIVTEGEGNYSWSVWFHLTDPVAMRIVHGAVLLVMFLFTIGFATRLTAALSFLAALQYVNRAQANLFGMDQMVIILALYLTIGNSGAVLSVDHWLERRGFSWARLFGGTTKPVTVEVEPSVSANLALRLIQVHMCFIYAAAGAAKLLGSSWWSGTALWWAVSNYEFTWFRYSWYSAFVQWLCSHRLIWELLITFAVVYTIVLQFSFPYLVWQRRFRWMLVSGAVLLHTTISALMGLLGFGLCMIAIVLSFIPGEATRAVLFGSQPTSPPPVLPAQAEDNMTVRLINSCTNRSLVHEPTTMA